MTFGQLLESLNYIPELEDVTDEYPLGKSAYHDFNAYRSNRGDNIITFKKDGAYEIHHADENFVSGRIKSNKEQQKRNYTFVPTMFHVAKKLVDSGEKVRIIASTNHDGGDLIGKYHSLANTIKNKYGFSVSELSQHTQEEKQYNSKGEEIKYKKFYVTPSNISEAIRMLKRKVIYVVSQELS